MYLVAPMLRVHTEIQLHDKKIEIACCEISKYRACIVSRIQAFDIVSMWMGRLVVFSPTQYRRVGIVIDFRILVVPYVVRDFENSSLLFSMCFLHFVITFIF